MTDPQTPEQPRKRRKYKQREGKDRALDMKHLRRVASFMYTDEELAVAMNVPIRSWYRYKQKPEILSVIQEGRAEFKMSLRRHQIAIAMGENYLKSNGVPWETRAKMMTHLGKQYLDQVERHEIRGNAESPLVTQQLDSDKKAEYKKKFATPQEVWNLLDAALQEKPQG